MVVPAAIAAGTVDRPMNRLLAETLGTYGLVFAGCGAIVIDHATAGSVSVTVTPARARPWLGAIKSVSRG